MCAPFNRDSLSRRKAEKGVWKIEITRPLCGVQRDGNRKECLHGYAGFLKKSIGRVSQKVLTAQLRDMEEKG